MTGNQRPDSIFLQVWTLYQTCRRNGVWAKIVVETSGGEEYTPSLPGSSSTAKPRGNLPLLQNLSLPPTRGNLPQNGGKTTLNGELGWRRSCKKPVDPVDPVDPLVRKPPPRPKRKPVYQLNPPVRKSPLRPWILRLYSRPVPLLHRGATTSYGHRGELYSQY